MSSDAVPAWTPSPWFLVTPPVSSATVVDRPRAAGAIDRAVNSHRVIEVTAPSGFGKSIAVSQWASRTELPVAWLTLTRFDDEPSRIARGVFTALRALAGRSADLGDRWLAGLAADLGDAAAGYDALCSAITEADGPVALVVDDAHLAGKGLEHSVVGALVEHPIPQLRLVLVGTERADLPLSGLRLQGTVDRLGARELAFTHEDVAAAGAAAGVELTAHDVDDIVDATAGWPVAVRLALIARTHTGRHDAGHPDGTPGVRPGHDQTELTTPFAESSLLTDYVADEVLDQLRPELTDFILAVTTCSRFDAALAAELSRAPDSSALLDECVRRALFLDHFDDADRETLYRWHEVFADSCRALLHRRDPSRAAHLNRVAARRLAEKFALEAVVHALRADDPGLATEIITSGWIGLIIRSHSSALGRLCGRLDPPWSTDPAILAIRASCLDADGDRAGAALLFGRATAHLDPQPPDATATASCGETEDLVAVHRFTIAAARLFLANDHAALMRAVDEVTSMLESTRALRPRTYASGLFVVGWTEMRLRRDPARAIELLRAAVRECDAVGEHDVADRARSNLCFALAYGGHLGEAEALHVDRGLSRAAARDHPRQAPPPYDGGIEPMATGFVAYWRDELPSATTALRQAIDADGGEATYAALARIYLAFVACISGDPQSMTDAEAGLDRVSDITQHGVPWPVYKTAARMKLAEARDQIDDALALARNVDESAYVPVCAVMAAEVLRRGGDVERAEVFLDAIAPSATASYLVASILLTRALIAHQRDDSGAHQLLEASLDAAAPESVIRPFTDDDPMLRELLVAHASWGTRHEGFVAARIARGQTTVSRHQILGDGLSPREHEVLSLMRTTMTASDIAAALYVSINTVKTHQRAIYRKLGVTNRRDAIRLTP